MSLALARFVANRGASWTEEQRNMMECSREACRTVVNQVGWCDKTDAFLKLWVSFTMLMVIESLGEERAAAVDHSGIGGFPIPPRELKVALGQLNPYAKSFLKKDLDAMEELLPILYAAADCLGFGGLSTSEALDLIQDVQARLMDVKAALGPALNIA